MSNQHDLDDAVPKPAQKKKKRSVNWTPSPMHFPWHEAARQRQEQDDNQDQWAD